MKEVTMSIRYGCAAGQHEIYIMLDTGPDRKVVGPQPATTSSIPYELYRRDAQGALTVWTNDMSKTTAYYLKDPKDKVDIVVDVIGRISAGPVPPFGPYVDPLVVRLSWQDSKHITREVTAPVRVTANLTTSCSVATTNLAFGNYDPLVVNGSAGSDLDAAATITVSCSGATATLVWITPGTGARIMTGPGNLAYELYSDDMRTVPWGSTQATAVPLGVPSGVAQPLTVYGSVPKGQDVPVGAYSQTVMVTVNF
jgi:spore coat protein U-like protein